MSGDAEIRFTGQLGGDPEMRVTASGVAVAGFQVAVTSRVRSAAGVWADGSTTWFRCTAWKSLAENVANSLRKGDRVSVVGTISSRAYEHEGEQRTSWDVRCDDVAPSLMWTGVEVVRTTTNRNKRDDAAPGDAAVSAPAFQQPAQQSEEPPF